MIRNKNKSWKQMVVGMALSTMLAVQAIVPMAANAATINADEALINSSRWIVALDTAPEYSEDNCWYIMDMKRSGAEVPERYYDHFENSVVQELKENGGKLNVSPVKTTEYSKLILTLTSLGVNAQDIGGYNLFNFINSVNKIKNQGINGPIWALLAYNSHPIYDSPSIEQEIIDYILADQLEDGGWTLNSKISKTSDSDITGMALYALAPYYNKDTKVTDAINKALDWAEKNQLATGGYGTGSIETSESISQMIVALSSLGIDCEKDSRFIKNGNSPLDALLTYYKADGENGAFMHVKEGSSGNGGAAAGEVNNMATYQAVYAINSYQRLLSGENTFYDMSDVELKIPEYTLGDVNGDGKIDMKDVAMMRQSIVGTVTLTSQQQQSADVDGNGKIDMKDVVKVRQYIVGTVTEL